MTDMFYATLFCVLFTLFFVGGMSIVDKFADHLTGLWIMMIEPARKEEITIRRLFIVFNLLLTIGATADIMIVDWYSFTGNIPTFIVCILIQWIFNEVVAFALLYLFIIIYCAVNRKSLSLKDKV